MTNLRKIPLSVVLSLAVIVGVLMYSLGYYNGCIQAIGPNENMGAALSMSCPSAVATVGEIMARIIPF